MNLNQLTKKIAIPFLATALTFSSASANTTSKENSLDDLVNHKINVIGKSKTIPEMIMYIKNKSKEEIEESIKRDCNYLHKSLTPFKERGYGDYIENYYNSCLIHYLN